MEIDSNGEGYSFVNTFSGSDTSLHPSSFDVPLQEFITGLHLKVLGLGKYKEYVDTW